MKFKLNYTSNEYTQLMCEFTVLEPPYAMVDLDKSLRTVNQVLSITDTTEFPKILAAKKYLERLPEETARNIFHYIKGHYKIRILNFLNSLVVIYQPSVFNPNTVYGELMMPHMHLYARSGFKPYIEICDNNIVVLHKEQFDKLGLMDNQDLFSFILLHFSQFKEFHHFDIYGNKR